MFAAVKDAKVCQVNTKDTGDVHNIKQGLCFVYPLSLFKLSPPQIALMESG